MSPARIDTFALTNHLLFFYYVSSKKTVSFLWDGRKNRRFLCKFAYVDLGAETAALIQGTHYDINGEMDISEKNKDVIYHGLKMNVSPTFSITVYFKE